MIYRDPKCVFVADDVATAGMIASLLTSKGFPAETMNEATLGGFEGLTALAPGISHRGMEVWVTDPAHADEAKAFLDGHHQAIQARVDARANQVGTVTAVCEECGKSSEWPPSQIGKTEDCPHCEAFMDIPDPEDDWDEVDVGASEEDDEEIN